MALEISDAQRPFVHPRRLTHIGEILKGEKKNKAGKRKAATRPKRPVSVNMADPISRLAWSLHERRRARYLNDINSRVRGLLGER